MCTDDLITLDRIKEVENLTIGTANICIAFIPGINASLKSIILFIGIFFVIFSTFSLVCKYKYGYGECCMNKFSNEIENIKNINSEFTMNVVVESTKESYINKLLVKNKNEKIRKILFYVILIGIVFIVDINKWYITLFILSCVQNIVSNMFSLIISCKYGEIYSHKLIKEALELEKKNDELEMKVRGEAADIVLRMIPFFSVTLLISSYFFGEKLLIIGMITCCFSDTITWCIKKILLRKYY